MAYADTGPIYVTYPGYCNIKQVYLSSTNYIYGYEIGCSTMLNQPLFGYLDATTGNAWISTYESSKVCMAIYASNGQLTPGCSNGVTFAAGSTKLAYAISYTMPVRATAQKLDMSSPSGELPTIPN